MTRDRKPEICHNDYGKRNFICYPSKPLKVFLINWKAKQRFALVIGHSGVEFCKITFGQSHRNREDKMAEEKVRTEEFHVNGDDIVKKIKELVHEGNIRRVIIKNEDGRTLIDIPLMLG